MPGLAQETTQSQKADAQAAPAKRKLPGQKQEGQGVILERDADTITMSDQTVRRRCWFRAAPRSREERQPVPGAKSYGQEQLFRGLNVEVEGVATATAGWLQTRSSLRSRA